MWQVSRPLAATSGGGRVRRVSEDYSRLLRELLGGHPLEDEELPPSPTAFATPPFSSMADGRGRGDGRGVGRGDGRGVGEGGVASSADDVIESLHQPLRAGDTLLLEAPAAFVEAHRSDSARFAVSVAALEPTRNRRATPACRRVVGNRARNPAWGMRPDDIRFGLMTIIIGHQV